MAGDKVDNRFKAMGKTGEKTFDNTKSKKRLICVPGRLVRGITCWPLKNL